MTGFVLPYQEEAPAENLSFTQYLHQPDVHADTPLS